VNEQVSERAASIGDLEDCQGCGIHRRYGRCIGLNESCWNKICDARLLFLFLCLWLDWRLTLPNNVNGKCEDRVYWRI